MHSQTRVLLNPIIKTIGFPGVREEHQGDRLAEIVQLETAGAHRVHDGRVVYHARGDAERAGSEDDVGVGRCTV